MTRGEIYRTAERLPERGGKPGFYVVVSRAVVAENDNVPTVVCARLLPGLGPDHGGCRWLGEGLPRTSAIRCDFLTLMFKSKLTQFISTLSPEKTGERNRALAVALDLSTDVRSRRA